MGSFPDIALNVFDPVFVEKVAVFLLKGPHPVMFLLGVDLMEQRLLLTCSHRERPIVQLPMKIGEGGVL